MFMKPKDLKVGMHVFVEGYARTRFLVDKVKSPEFHLVYDLSGQTERGEFGWCKLDELWVDSNE